MVYVYNVEPEGDRWFAQVTNVHGACGYGATKEDAEEAAKVAADRILAAIPDAAAREAVAAGAGGGISGTADTAAPLETLLLPPSARLLDRIVAAPAPSEVSLRVEAMNVLGIGVKGEIVLSIRAVIPANTLELQRGIGLLPKNAEKLAQAVKGAPKVTLTIAPDAMRRGD